MRASRIRKYATHLAGLFAVVAVCINNLEMRSRGQAPLDERAPHATLGVAQAIAGKPNTPEIEKTKKPDEGPKVQKIDKKDGVLLYEMPVTLPKHDDLFRIDSEAMFRERLRAEVRKSSPKVKLEFPESEPLVIKPESSRPWPDYVKWVEPNYVISKRLSFEQRRFERFGESLGILQPGVSASLFCLDLVLWPVNRMTQPFRCYQLNIDSYSPYFQNSGK